MAATALVVDDRFVEIGGPDRRLRIEVRLIDPAASERVGANRPPRLVFLHEGLGSVAMWRDFPQRLCAACGLPGLVYSRVGYGRSTPRAAHQSWDSDFMHVEAHLRLPALLDALAIDSPVWLFGHSDGGSIALLFAAAHPERLAGAIVLAPHIMVEPLAVASIGKARSAYLETDLRQRLARYHDDVDSAFFGWNDVWLLPDFRDWDIGESIATIDRPLLAIQGVDDEYGTLEQIRGIARRVQGTELLELPDCGHSPHRDQPQAVITATRDFIARHPIPPERRPDQAP